MASDGTQARRDSSTVLTFGSAGACSAGQSSLYAARRGTVLDSDLPWQNGQSR